jgi:hypothetical protein
MIESEVKLDKSGAFQYIKIEKHNRRHFCLQQSLVVLAWVLLFKKDTISPNRGLDSNKKSARFVVGWLRYNFGLFRENLMLLIIFAGYKYHFVRIDSVVRLPLLLIIFAGYKDHFVRIDSMVKLPFYGHICVPVHKGYKIFDLRRKVAIKVFDNKIDTYSISKEIEQLKTVSQLVFAPSIRRSNIAERWYEEDYVSGFLDVSVKPPDSRTVLERFSPDVVQPLKSLVLLRQPIKKNAIEYINDTIKILEVSRLSRKESTVKDFRKIKSFLDFMLEHFQLEGQCRIFLVFSHGDFCPENMMHTRHGIKIFDWESATYRSTLFDFYSYFFHRARTYKIPVHVLASEIKEALPIFISTIAKITSDISTSLSHLEDEYRRLYYIERICMLVEREMTDQNLNILKDHILRFIEIFSRYEETRIGITVAHT